MAFMLPAGSFLSKVGSLQELRPSVAAAINAINTFFMFAMLLIVISQRGKCHSDVLDTNSFFADGQANSLIKAEPKRCMTLRIMGHIARLMQETSARLLSGILRLSQSSILRANKDILTLIDVARPICLDGRRALIIDEKYLGRGKKFVTCVIDGYSGEILWLK